MKYITLDEGIDFRRIAKIMTDAGFQMNHATARNVLIGALRSLLEKMATEFNVKITEDKMLELLRSQQVHDALADVLIETHMEMQNEKQ